MTSQTFARAFHALWKGLFLLLSLFAVSCQKDGLTELPQESKTVSSTDSNPDAGIDVAVSDRGVNDPKLAIKIFLSGPYVASTQLMNDNLRTTLVGGVSLIPTTSPYSGRTETIANPTTVLAVTGNNAIVDWVLVELRSSDNVVAFTASGLIQRDGDIVEAADGVSALSFPGASTSTSYQVAVKHRNHLGCLTKNETAGRFTPSISSPPSVDLTACQQTSPFTPTIPTYAPANNTAIGRRPMTGNGVRRLTLFCGDGAYNATRDLVVKYNTSAIPPPCGACLPFVGSDSRYVYDRVWNDAGQPNPKIANHIVTAYDPNDINLDGKVIWQGVGNDQSSILLSVVGSPLNTTASSSFWVIEAIP